MFCFIGLVSVFLVGLFLSEFLDYRGIKSIKEENEKLNKELNRLTDRDEKGRYVRNEP